jgi:hypothetical protein
MKELKEILSECMREAVSIEDLAERLTSVGVTFAPADNVEVVRCKDCKHCKQSKHYEEKGKESRLEYVCCAFGNVSPDFYCGIGERREE